MKIEEYSRYDALGIASLVRAGEVSAREVVEAALSAIESLNPRLNAVVLLDPERARDQADRIDRNAPLAGVPFLVKDNNVYVDGWPTTFSCHFYKDAPPRPDSELVARWRKAGLVLIGKTSTPEFAADWTTEPTLRGPTRNPWNLAHSPGGSSGGSAAAVASGMVPAAHGNDNAGSIRVPAAASGLFGLKPTRGLVPIGLYFGELAAGHDCEHALTRTVRDSASLLDATAGPEPGGRYHVKKGVASYLEALEQPTGQLRIGCVTEGPGGAEVDPEIAEALASAAQLLDKEGHSVETISYPADPAFSLEAETIWMTEIALLVRNRAEELGREPRRDEIEALTAFAVERTKALSAVDYLQALHRLHGHALRMVESTREFDLILTPTTGRTAPLIGEFDTRTERFDHETWAEQGWRFAPFTEMFNLTGQPAASIPAGLSSHGMPIGVQIAAQPGRDELVLQVARLLEAKRGPLRRISDLLARHYWSVN